MNTSLRQASESNMKLKDIINNCTVLNVKGNLELDINSIEFDSRKANDTT